MAFGIANVAAITSLVYILGLALKAAPVDHKWIPSLCGILGIVLGILAFFLELPDFPAADPLTAAAVGGVSGLAATGLNQMVKQMQK